LVLTQLSVGAFVAALLLERPAAEPGSDLLAELPLRPLHAVNSLLFGILALGASLFHLGRPQYAFRAVLGLRHSWLSREIVAFGVFALLATAYAGAILTEHAAIQSNSPSLEKAAWIRWLGWMVAGSGVSGLFCSVMIYAFVRRECWSFTRVSVRFILTAALLGVAACWLSILLASVHHPSPALIDAAKTLGPKLCKALIAAAALKLIWEGAIFQHLACNRMTPLRRSALLLTRDLSSITLARFALGLLGGIVMPALLLNALPTLSEATFAQFTVTTALLFLACLAGELLERYLFFTACATPRMPGAIH
jgi:DMSO reductase anchor subunit